MNIDPTPSHAEALRYLKYAEVFLVGDITVDRRPAFNRGWRLTRDDGRWVMYYDGEWVPTASLHPGNVMQYLDSLADAIATAEKDYEKRSGERP